MIDILIHALEDIGAIFLYFLGGILISFVGLVLNIFTAICVDVCIEWLNSHSITKLSIGELWTIDFVFVPISILEMLGIIALSTMFDLRMLALCVFPFFGLIYVVGFAHTYKWTH